MLIVSPSRVSETTARMRRAGCVTVSATQRAGYGPKWEPQVLSPPGRTNNSDSLTNRWIGRPSESEGVAADAAGNLYGAEVTEQGVKVYQSAVAPGNSPCSLGNFARRRPLDQDRDCGGSK
jgi:hypothetical protein